MFGLSSDRLVWLLWSQLLLLRASIHADEQIPLSTADTADQSLLWGPYRPNLYFGVRPRVPNSLLAGLMWSRVDNYATVQNSMEANLDLALLANNARLSTHLRAT